MKRFGFVIRVEPGEIERYREYHRNVWPEVLDAMRRSNIRNYSIFLKDDLLFGYYEYHGPDHSLDMTAHSVEPEDTGMVVDHDAHATSARQPQDRRMVGADG